MKPRPILLSLLLVVGFLFSVVRANDLLPCGPKREVRAVWMATIGGLDWPRSYARSPQGIELQKQQLRNDLDMLQSTGINTVLLQTRIRGTVIYPSSLEPWDGCLSGVPGRSPGYDALQFAIDECHSRGMELHAWVVCMPVCSKTLVRQLGGKALPRQHAGLCRPTQDGWMMDPGMPGTATYLARLCGEIVSRYDVDGISLDYIRYPEKEIAFNDNATYRRYGNGVPKAAWRRACIDRCVQHIYNAVKALKPWVKVSASPVGKYADLPRYSSYGWNARDAVFQDAQSWLQKGFADLLLPMMYFKGNHFYPFAADWRQNRHAGAVAPGLGLYMLSPKEKNWDAGTLVRELQFLRSIGADGQAFFRSRFLTGNVKDIRTYLQTFFYRTPALPIALTRIDSTAPSAPGSLELERQSDGTIRLSWTEAYDPTPGDRLRYNIYRSHTWPVDTENPQNLYRVGLTGTQTVLYEPLELLRPAFYAVRAMDRYGNEGAPATFGGKTGEAHSTERYDGFEKLKERLEHEPTGGVELLDAEGRTLQRPARGALPEVRGLTPGMYRLRAPGKKKRTWHNLGTFFVKP